VNEVCHFLDIQPYNGSPKEIAYCPRETHVHLIKATCIDIYIFFEYSVLHKQQTTRIFFTFITTINRLKNKTKTKRTLEHNEEMKRKKGKNVT